MDKLAQALRDVAEFGTAGFSIDVNPRHQSVDVVISNGPKTRGYNGVFKVGEDWRDSVAAALFEATAPWRADWKKDQDAKRAQLAAASATFNKQQDEIESLQARLVEAQNQRDKTFAHTKKLREELGESEGFLTGGVIGKACINASNFEVGKITGCVDEATAASIAKKS